MKSTCALCLLFVATCTFAQNRFLYLNNQSNPNSITAWQIGPGGALTQLAGSPFATGGTGTMGPVESMAIVRVGSGPVLYAANGADPSVSALTINATTGALTPIAGSPFTLNDSAGTWDMAASPDRRFLFVANEADTTIHVFSIDPQTGALTEVSGSPFDAGANIAGLYVTANNKYLLAAANSINAVEVFAIANSGAITQVSASPFPANAPVADVRSNCASNRVFTADNGSNLIDAYSLSPAGALTPVPGSPFSNGATGNGPNSFDLAIAPNGKFLFTTDSFSTDITSFTIATNGSLSQALGSPYTTGGWLGGTAITARGDFLYSVDIATAAIDGRTILPNGTLAPVTGSGFSGGIVSLNGEPNSVISYPPPACPTVATR